jgi:hypothetical protein
VRKLQLEDARVVLAEISFELPAAAPRAVEDPPARWKGPLLWWSLALALGAVFTAIGLIQTVSSMEQCAQTSCARPQPAHP